MNTHSWSVRIFTGVVAAILFGGSGRAETNDATATIEETKVKAEKGDADAQERLGNMYLMGKGVPKNGNEAIYWLQKAAEQGDPRVQGWLALHLRNGGLFPGMKIVGKDSNEAARWFLRAARQGHALSQKAIGEMYAHGEGVRQDFVEAYKWFNIAATSADFPSRLVTTNGVDLGTLQSTAEDARHARAELAS